MDLTNAQWGNASKPPFFHWLAALPAFVFGPIDWVVRLPSAIAAAIMAAVTFFMGREMGGRRVGWLAAGALLGMQEFWVSGTQARVDMVFATCLSVALAGFFFWYRNGHRAARATCYIAAACAVLAKGPVGLSTSRRDNRWLSGSGGTASISMELVVLAAHGRGPSSGPRLVRLGL